MNVDMKEISNRIKECVVYIGFQLTKSSVDLGINAINYTGLKNYEFIMNIVAILTGDRQASECSDIIKNLKKEVDSLIQKKYELAILSIVGRRPTSKLQFITIDKTFKITIYVDEENKRFMPTINQKAFIEKIQLLTKHIDVKYTLGDKNKISNAHLLYYLISECIGKNERVKILKEYQLSGDEFDSAVLRIKMLNCLSI